MKRVAFLQALVLFVLLVISWVLITLRFRGEESPPTPSETESPDPSTIQVAGDSTSESLPANQPLNNSPVPEPEGWMDWIEYIRSQPDTIARRQAIEALKATLYEMPGKEAVARILEFLESGFDLQTGLRFQVGKSGVLLGSGSLRASMLDWLGQLDPQAAANVAYTELTAQGTDLHPEVYVLHLRNYAWGTPAGSQSGFLRKHFEKLIDHESWISQPTPSIGEAMDVAVYLQDQSLIPIISRLADPNQNPNLRHAAKLALERLVEMDPLNAGLEILDGEAKKFLDGRSRASLLSRIDPNTAVAQDLLARYLLSPDVERGEVQIFLQYLPNLNISYSYNLLSPENPNTQSIHHGERLLHALDTIEAWQEDPRFSRYWDLLADRETTLRVQLYGNPKP